MNATTANGTAIALASVGAACFALASVLQHDAVRAEQGTGDEPVPPLHSRRAMSADSLVGIMRSPGWLRGLALAGAGSAIHASALLLAPLRVVQPVGVLSVPLAVLLSAARRGRRPTFGVGLGVLLTVVGVVSFVVASASSAVGHAPTGAGTLIAGTVVATTVGIVGAVGFVLRGTRRALAFSVAGAAAFGLVSALVRAVSQSVLAGDVGLLDGPVLGAGAGVVGALLVGGWFVQHAYQAGAPEIVIASLTFVDPLVAVLVGSFLLGEGTSTSSSTWMVLGAATLVAASGVLTLAHRHPDAVAARHAVQRRPSLTPEPTP